MSSIESQTQPAASFARLLLEQRPLLDVRAEIEFERGAAPGAVNIPLLDTVQRQAVGTCYKHQGQDAAIALGHELINGDVLRQRMAAWMAFCHQYPNAALYCARGGLRSRLTQEALREVGFEIPRIEGGYKALRQFLISNLQLQAETQDFLILTGRTGSGKTELLARLSEHRRTVDLEACAAHRGSAFGQMAAQQPSVANFENQVSVDLLKSATALDRPPGILMEDESRMIGRLEIPSTLFNRILQSPLYLVEESVESRARFILESYMNEKRLETELASEAMIRQLGSDLEQSLVRISRRLGGVRTDECRKLMQDGLQEQLASGTLEAHLPWIRFLLREYYDPVYTTHIERQSARIRLRGSREEIFACLSQVP